MRVSSFSPSPERNLPRQCRGASTESLVLCLALDSTRPKIPHLSTPAPPVTSAPPILQLIPQSTSSQPSHPPHLSVTAYNVLLLVVKNVMYPIIFSGPKPSKPSRPMRAGQPLRIPSNRWFKLMCHSLILSCIHESCWASVVSGASTPGGLLTTATSDELDWRWPQKWRQPLKMKTTSKMKMTTKMKTTSTIKTTSKMKKT